MRDLSLAITFQSLTVIMCKSMINDIIIIINMVNKVSNYWRNKFKSFMDPDHPKSISDPRKDLRMTYLFIYFIFIIVLAKYK